MGQHQMLQNWMAMYRWIYNRTVEVVKDRLDKKVKNAFDFQLVRDQCIRKMYKYEKHQYPDWYTGGKVPPRVLDGAIKTCCQNFKSNMEKLKAGFITKFSIRMKSKKDSTSIVISNDSFSKTKNAFNLAELGPIKSSEVFFKYPHHSSWLSYDPKKETYTLFLPVLTFQVPLPMANKEIALDPGEKIFLAGYSPNGEVVKIGVMCRHRLMRIDRKLATLNSKLSTLKSTKRKNKLRKRKYKLIQRKKNLRDDLHWKTISFLTKNYDSIILGDMSVQAIEQKIRDKRVKDTFRGLSPYMFKQRLEWKCNMAGREFVYQDESYTSQTCTKCGSLTKPKDRVYDCSSCKSQFHRDLNAARNIWLRWRCDANKMYTAKITKLRKLRDTGKRDIVHTVETIPKTRFPKPGIRKCPSVNDLVWQNEGGVGILLENLKCIVDQLSNT